VAATWKVKVSPDGPGYFPVVDAETPWMLAAVTAPTLVLQGDHLGEPGQPCMAGVPGGQGFRSAGGRDGRWP
jgi:hypothetical protein